MGYSVNHIVPPRLGQKRSLHTTYPGNTTTAYRNAQMNDLLRGPQHTQGVEELVYDPLNDVAKGLNQLQEAKRNKMQFSKSRDTLLPTEKRAVQQYANFNYAPMAVVRSIPHNYHSGCPSFAIDKTPTIAPQTRTVLGDKQIPNDRMTTWTVTFGDIPVGGRAFVGLLQDSPDLNARHLTSSNPLLFWTDLWEARVEGCGLDIWRMQDGRLRMTVHHLPTREDTEYLGRTVPVNDKLLGEIYPPESFSNPPSKVFETGDRLALVKEGLGALAAFREKKGLTQYAQHTRSVPSFTDRPVAEVPQLDGPLEIRITTKEAKVADTGTRNIRGLEVRFNVGTLEGVVSPVRTWDPQRGMRRYIPCVGIGKDVVVIKKRERVTADFADENFWSTFLTDPDEGEPIKDLDISFPLACHERKDIFASTRSSHVPTWVSAKTGRNMWESM